VFTADLRGHGESGPYAVDGADFSYDDIVRYDLPALVRYARKRMPNRHISVLGHSLSGHAAMIASGLKPDDAPDSIVGIASNLWLPKLERRRRSSWSKQIALSSWALVVRRSGYFDARRLKLGRWGVPAGYVNQFAEMFRRNQLGPTGGRAEYEEALRRVHLPIYTLASEGDRVLSTPDNVAAFMALMPHADVTRRVLWKRDGAPQPGHMGLVMDPSCETEWSAIAQWVYQQADNEQEAGQR
jgi:predicted alpha/beta hydrolase